MGAGRRLISGSQPRLCTLLRCQSLDAQVWSLCLLLAVLLVCASLPEPVAGGYVGYALTTSWDDGGGKVAAAAGPAGADPRHQDKQASTAASFKSLQVRKAVGDDGAAAAASVRVGCEWHLLLLLQRPLPLQLLLVILPDMCMQVIGFDMGGTSTDVSRYAGSYEHVFESTTAGVTIQAPQLDINTVAAGGGSRLFYRWAEGLHIGQSGSWRVAQSEHSNQRWLGRAATVLTTQLSLHWEGGADRCLATAAMHLAVTQHLRNGLFVVGPESCRAHPGPVCYKKGGYLAITDANLALGRILPETFPHIFGPHEVGRHNDVHLHVSANDRNWMSTCCLSRMGVRADQIDAFSLNHHHHHHHQLPLCCAALQNEPLDAAGTRAAFESLTAEVNADEAAAGKPPKSVDEVAMGFIRVANEAMCRPIRCAARDTSADMCTALMRTAALLIALTTQETVLTDMCYSS